MAVMGGAEMEQYYLCAGVLLQEITSPLVNNACLCVNVWRVLYVCDAFIVCV